MKDRRRLILKQLLNGAITGSMATRELKSGGKPTVTVWLQDREKRVWRKMGSDEVMTFEEHREKRQRDSLNKHHTVITIGGRNHE